MIKDKVIQRILNEAEEKFGLTQSQLEDICDSWPTFIRSKIVELDFDDIQTDEEFEELKTNFNLPYIGKLHTNFKNLEYKRKQAKIRREVYERKKQN